MKILYIIGALGRGDDYGGYLLGCFRQYHTIPFHTIQYPWKVHCALGYVRLEMHKSHNIQYKYQIPKIHKFLSNLVVKSNRPYDWHWRWESSIQVTYGRSEKFWKSMTIYVWV